MRDMLPPCRAKPNWMPKNQSSCSRFPRTPISAVSSSSSWCDDRPLGRVRVQYTLSTMPGLGQKKRRPRGTSAFVVLSLWDQLPGKPDRRRPRSREGQPIQFRRRRWNRTGKRHLSMAQTRKIRRRCWRKECSSLPWRPCSRRRCKTRLPPCSLRRSCPHQGTCNPSPHMNRRRCWLQDSCGCSTPASM